MPANKLFNYPHNAFLMLRLEFVAICQEQELEAMLLRIIEMHVDAKRQSLFVEAMNKKKAPRDQVVDIPKDLWVPISYKLFMNDLYGIVTSENTIKKALRSLEQKRLIFSRPPQKGKYNAPEYQLHVTVIQILLDVVGKPGYQLLIPSIIDALKKLPPQFLIPSECQKLIPSKINLSSGEESRVSEIDTNIRKDTDKNKDKKERTYEPSPLSFSSSEEEQPPTIFTPDEETLRAWLEADNPRKGKAETLKTHLQKMLPHVDTKEKAHDLFLHTQKLIARSDRKDKTVSVGNMVEDWILNAWLQTQQTEPEPEQVSTPALGDQIGMTKEQADEVKAAMLEHCPSLDPVIAISECDGVYTVGLAINETEWADIFTPTDWHHLPQDILDQCINYGEMILQYEAIEIASA